MYGVGRYYDPTTGQFLTVDPAVDTTGLPYAYASGNPVENVDPNGLQSQEPPAITSTPGGGLAALLLLLTGICASNPALCPHLHLPHIHSASSNDESTEPISTDESSTSDQQSAAEDAASSQYAGLSNNQLNKLLPPDQRDKLRQLFGQSLAGAQKALSDLKVPEGLTQKSLEIYEEIANRAIAAGRDRSGVQAARLDVVKRVMRLFS